MDEYAFPQHGALANNNSLFQPPMQYNNNGMFQMNALMPHSLPMGMPLSGQKPTSRQPRDSEEHLIPESSGRGKGKESSGSAYASRHQQAEQRRRTRINERLELLRKTVPHSERSNTACFLEQVLQYISNLKNRVSELEDLLQSQSIQVPQAIDPTLGPSFEEMREVSSRSGEQARQSDLTISLRPRQASPLASNAPQLQFPLENGLGLTSHQLDQQSLGSMQMQRNFQHFPSLELTTFGGGGTGPVDRGDSRPQMQQQHMMQQHLMNQQAAILALREEQQNQTAAILAVHQATRQFQSLADLASTLGLKAPGMPPSGQIGSASWDRQSAHPHPPMNIMMGGMSGMGPLMGPLHLGATANFQGMGMNRQLPSDMLAQGSIGQMQYQLQNQQQKAIYQNQEQNQMPPPAQKGGTENEVNERGQKREREQEE